LLFNAKGAIFQFNYDKNMFQFNEMVFPGTFCTRVSFTNKADCHDMAEILLKVGLNTITLTHNEMMMMSAML